MSPGAYVSWLRPSIVPDKKYYLEIPFLSSFNCQYSNSSFTYHDLYKRRADDSTFFDIDNILSKMKDNNFIGFNFSNVIIGFGMRIKKCFITFNVNERLDFGFAFPKELIDFIDKGNGPYIGKTLEFKNVSLDIMHFREYAFGFSGKINDKIFSGIRVKYLYGMENVSTVNKNLSLTTKQDDYSLHLISDITLNTSTFFNSKNGYNNLNLEKYIFGLNNRGVSIDIGTSFKINDKFELNGSLLDLGFIRWKDNLKNFRISSDDYEFKGIDLQEFVNDTAENVQYLLDSLSQAYKPLETVDSYSTALHSRIFLSGSYKFREKTSANMLFNLKFYNGLVSPAFSFSAQQKIGKAVSFSLSYSYVNNSFDNLGIGFLFQSKILSMFFVTDNIFGIIKPLNYRTTGVRGGVYFNWGLKIDD